MFLITYGIMLEEMNVGNNVEQHRLVHPLGQRDDFGRGIDVGFFIRKKGIKYKVLYVYLYIQQNHYGIINI